MTNARTTLTTTLALLGASMALAADPFAGGSIDNWTHGEAEIFSFGAAGPFPIGTVSASGAVALTGSDKVKATQSVNMIYGCNGAVNISDPEATYFSPGSDLMVGVIAERKHLGYLMVADSAATGKAMHDRSTSGTPVGSHYVLMYTPSAVTVAGSCESTGLVAEGQPTAKIVNNYGMQLNAGWNLLEWKVISTYTNHQGLAKAKESTFTTIDSLPATTAWVFNAND